MIRFSSCQTKVNDAKRKVILSENIRNICKFGTPKSDTKCCFDHSTHFLPWQRNLAILTQHYFSRELVFCQLLEL